MKNKNTFYVDSEGKFVSYALVYANLSSDKPRAYWDKELTNPVSFKDGISLISNICVIDVNSHNEYPIMSRPYNFTVLPSDAAASFLPDINPGSDLIGMTMIDSNDDTTFKTQSIFIYDEIV